MADPTDATPDPVATPDPADMAADAAGSPGAAQPAARPRATQRILAQYVRDLSFENVLARKGLSGELQPETAVAVSLDGRRRGGAESQFEVMTKVKVTSKSRATGDVLFALELEYVGVFQIENLPEEQVHPYLLVECPRITFPFVRRIVSDVTRDGGFPAVNLEMIDFVALYRSEIARRAQGTQAGVPQAPPRLDA